MRVQYDTISEGAEQLRIESVNLLKYRRYQLRLENWQDLSDPTDKEVWSSRSRRCSCRRSDVA